MRSARQFNPVAHVPLLCAGNRIGWLRQTYARRLWESRDVFEPDPQGLRLVVSLNSPEARTAAIDAVISSLYQEGAITGWRDERYAVVTAFDAMPIFHIERAAARYLGVTTYSAHANGYCGNGAACKMWLARRAATKQIDPGMLDNLVGGGMSAGMAPYDNLVGEAWEEAGISAHFARNAAPAGTVHLLREVAEGVQSEVIFVHDLELPFDFQPSNVDGEVAEFRRVPIAEIVKILNTATDIALEAALVMLSFVERRKYIELDRAALVGVFDAKI